MFSELFEGSDRENLIKELTKALTILEKADKKYGREFDCDVLGEIGNMVDNLREMDDEDFG